jgi:hypothetical protein
MKENNSGKPDCHEIPVLLLVSVIYFSFCWWFGLNLLLACLLVNPSMASTSGMIFLMEYHNL